LTNEATIVFSTKFHQTTPLPECATLNSLCCEWLFKFVLSHCKW